jgi:hypothetical protein
VTTKYSRQADVPAYMEDGSPLSVPAIGLPPTLPLSMIGSHVLRGERTFWIVWIVVFVRSFVCFFFFVCVVWLGFYWQLWVACLPYDHRWSEAHPSDGVTVLLLRAWLHFVCMSSSIGTMILAFHLISLRWTPIYQIFSPKWRRMPPVVSLVVSFVWFDLFDLFCFICYLCYLCYLLCFCFLCFCLHESFFVFFWCLSYAHQFSHSYLLARGRRFWWPIEVKTGRNSAYHEAETAKTKKEQYEFCNVACFRSNWLVFTGMLFSLRSF